MIDNMLACKVLFQEKHEKAKSKIRGMKSKTKEQLRKKVEHVEWLQDHIYNLHERHIPTQYEVKISGDGGCECK
jgi:ribosome recycling factor